jgi:hypothetical protein
MYALPDPLFVSSAMCAALVVAALSIGVVIGWMMRHDKPQPPRPPTTLRYTPPRCVLASQRKRVAVNGHIFQWAGTFADYGNILAVARFDKGAVVEWHTPAGRSGFLYPDSDPLVVVDDMWFVVTPPPAARRTIPYVFA